MSKLKKVLMNEEIMKLIINNILNIIHLNIIRIYNSLKILICILSVYVGARLITGLTYLPDNVILGLIFVMLSLIYLDRVR